MADYAPPAGPPPPKVPEGWKAVFNDQYKEWFYVNIYTKQSQWDKPTEPIYPPGEAPPDGAPPGYDPHTAQATTEKGSNNPFLPQQHSGAGPAPGASSDEEYARQLQEQENARATSSGGMNSNYYNGPPQPQYGQSSQYDQQLPPRQEKKGLLGKLSSKLSGSSSSSRQYGGYPGGGYPQQYPRQQYGYGHGPPGPYGYGQPGYGAPYGGGYGGGYGGYPPRRSGGMGAGGGAALGLGAGLLGGALIADSINDGQEDAYQEGYDDGGGGDDGGGE